jgi:hypothetical protein
MFAMWKYLSSRRRIVWRESAFRLKQTDEEISRAKSSLAMAIIPSIDLLTVT